MIETELKFQVPPTALPALRVALRALGARSKRLAAVYHDTADGLLGRHGLSLRLRREGRAWVQTLKWGDDGAVERLEHEVRVRPVAGLPPVLDVSRHAGTPVGERLAELLMASSDAVLEARFSVEVSRLSGTFASDAGSVEVSLDVGALRAGERSAPVCELELERVSGSVESLVALAAAWSAHEGMFLHTLSKARRGEVLARGALHGPAVKSKPVPIEPGMSGPALVRAVLGATLRQVFANAGEVAFGSRAEEHIHQLRVGLRRLRVALRELSALDAEVDPSWEPAIAAGFAALGALRDEQAVLRTVRPLLEQAQAPTLAWGAPAADADPGAVVRERGFQQVLLRLLGHALSPAAPEEASHEVALGHVAQRLARLRRRVVRDGARFTALPVEEQHAVRKRLKRLRYLAEFVAPLWKRKRVQRFLAALGPAQDALGTHHDIVVAIDRYRLHAESDPRAWYAAGFLQAHAQATARAAQEALGRVGDAPGFWKDR